MFDVIVMFTGVGVETFAPPFIGMTMLVPLMDISLLKYLPPSSSTTFTTVPEGRGIEGLIPCKISIESGCPAWMVVLGIFGKIARGPIGIFTESVRTKSVISFVLKAVT